MSDWAILHLEQNNGKEVLAILLNNDAPFLSKNSSSVWSLSFNWNAFI